MFLVWRDHNKLTVTEENAFNDKLRYKVEAECATYGDAERFIQLERELAKFLFILEKQEKQLAQRH
jgi:hypothetical protein